MLTLHSLRRQSSPQKSDDETYNHKINMSVKKGLAASLVIAGFALTDIYMIDLNTREVMAAQEAQEGTDGEESDTKAKIQDGFGSLALSVEMLSRNVVSENFNVDSEPLAETREVISTMVTEKATETVKAANLLSQEDYNVLLRIVEAEAGGEDITGKILVANVVMNRVGSSTFPESVTSVVYEKSQFSPVSDGRINTVTVSEDTIEAVGRALSGEDYSQGAYYFSARDKANYSSMQWFDSNLKWLFQHGGHEFYTFR